MDSPVSLSCFGLKNVETLGWCSESHLAQTAVIISDVKPERWNGEGVSGELGRQNHGCVRGQGWAGLDETLAQRRCLVRWSLGSESPWCLSPGLGKSCFIYIIPLSPRYMLLVSVSRNGFNKDNLANVLSRVLFLLGFSNGLVSTSQPVTGYQIKQAKVFA